MNHFSLFTGIGGIDLAAEWAGFTSVGQCEWADFQTKVLEKHWPNVPKWRDIRSVTSESVRAAGINRIDLLSGGFPCQPFSHAGNRGGTSDDRYLWPEMLRVISELQPTWVVGENVAGLITMDQSDGQVVMEDETAICEETEMVLETIRKDFERIGYQSQPIVIPACAVNARHRRDRIFILAYSGHYELPGWNEITEGHKHTRRRAAWSEPSSCCCNVADSACERCREARQHRCNQPKERTTGSGETVSDTTSKRLQEWRQSGFTEGDKETGAGLEPKFERCSEDVADTNSLPGFQASTTVSSIGSQRDSWNDACGSGRGYQPGTSWWSTEPELGRVAYGIPERVDRLKSLGNAVVPQQVYPILKAIWEVHHGYAGQAINQG